MMEAEVMPSDSAPPLVVAVPHVPHDKLPDSKVSAYRSTIVRVARQAMDVLPQNGLFIVGAQDKRLADGGLVPLSFLVLEDINRAVGEHRLRLKELVVAVP